jgi:hypothetical protein
MVYGPPIHPIPSLNELNESNSQLWKIISSGKDAEVPDAPIPLYVDVRDIAMAHVLAMESPKAANQRYTVTGAQYSNQEAFNHTIFANSRLSILFVTSFRTEISFLSDTRVSTSGAVSVIPRRSEKSLELNSESLGKRLKIWVLCCSKCTTKNTNSSIPKNLKEILVKRYFRLINHLRQPILSPIA